MAIPSASSSTGESLAIIDTKRAVRLGVWTIPYASAVFLANLAAAILFFAFGPYSNFSGAGQLDPWIYTGYFTHFRYLMDHYGLTYYVSRLPWIVPGLLVFKIATPAVASVLLNSLITAISASALYFIVYWNYGSAPAAFACIALITNPYFVYTVSWDYPDGPSIAYAFVAVACVLRPASRSVWPGVVAGMSMLLSAATNLAAAPALAAILIIPLWRNRKSLQDLMRASVSLLGGAVGAAFGLAFVCKFVLNFYLFYLPQYGQILYVRSHPGYLEQMWGTGYAWIPAAYRLAPIAFILFCGGVALVRTRKWNGTFLESYLFLVVTFALLCLGEFAFHNVNLRVPYVGSYIVCPLLTCAGLLFGEILSSCGTRGRASASTGRPTGESLKSSEFTIGFGRASELRWGVIKTRKVLWGSIAIVGIGLPLLFADPPSRMAAPISLWSATLVLATVVGLVSVARRISNPFLIGLTCSLIYAGLFIGPACDGGIGYIWSKGNVDTFQTALRIESVVDSGTPWERTVRFWYDSNEPSTPLFDSAYSLYLWGYFDFTKQLPSTSVAEIKRLVNSKTTLAHLTIGHELIAERTQLLLNRGIKAGNERTWIIPSHLGPIHLVLQDVLDDSDMH